MITFVGSLGNAYYFNTNKSLEDSTVNQKVLYADVRRCLEQSMMHCKFDRKAYVVSTLSPKNIFSRENMKDETGKMHRCTGGREKNILKTYERVAKAAASKAVLV